MHKKIKIFVSALLIVLLASSVTIIYANYNNSKDKVEGEMKISLYQCGDFEVQKNLDDNVSLASVYSTNNNLKEFEDFLYQQISNCATQFDIDQNLYKYTVKEFVDIYANVVNSNPELFYVNNAFRYSCNSDSPNYVSFIMPEYIMKEPQITNGKIAFNKGVNDALSLIDDSMDDMQKALVLHDYLCDISNYKYVDPVSHTALAVFRDHEAVCSGYALAYLYLLKQVGVPCEYVTSPSMNHGWNIVNINGKWYQTDVTWDDPVINRENVNVRGMISHKHFLKSDSYLQSENGTCHHSYSTYNGTTALDTSLDNYFWNDVSTYIPVVDGNYYYLRREDNSNIYNSYFKLVKRDKQSNETCVNSLIFNAQPVNFSGNKTAPDGHTYKSVTINDYIRVAYADERFYIASRNKIQSVFTDGSYYDIAPINDHNKYGPNGFGIQHGDLVYQLYDNVNPTIIDRKQYLDKYFDLSKTQDYNNFADVNYDKVVNTKDFAKFQNTNYIFS